MLLTADISQSTGKGRHTSIRREMVVMDDSGVLIDTLGIREFGLAVDAPDSLAEILEISDCSKSCRFKDCTHTSTSEYEKRKKDKAFSKLIDKVKERKANL